MAVNNPQGSNTPAGNTMSVPRGQSGGRTRNVVNINQPGSEGTVARTYSPSDSADAVPSGAAAGFANFRRQRYLHVSATNLNSGGNFKFKIWLYNSAFGQWAPLSFADAQTPAGATMEITLATGNPNSAYYIFDINGAERIYFQSTASIGSGGTGAKVFLGVNSF